MIRKYYDLDLTDNAAPGYGGEIPADELQRIDQDAANSYPNWCTEYDEGTAFHGYVNGARSEYLRHLSQPSQEAGKDGKLPEWYKKWAEEWLHKMECQGVDPAVRKSFEEELVWAYKKVFYEFSALASQEAKPSRVLRFIKSTKRLPAVHSEPVIVRSLQTGHVQKMQNWGHNKGWDTGMDRTFLWENTEWLEELPSESPSTGDAVEYSKVREIAKQAYVLGHSNACGDEMDDRPSFSEWFDSKYPLFAPLHKEADVFTEEYAEAIYQQDPEQQAKRRAVEANQPTGENDSFNRDEVKNIILDLTSDIESFAKISISEWLDTNYPPPSDKPVEGGKDGSEAYDKWLDTPGMESPFHGEEIGTIGVNPDTGDLRITPSDVPDIHVGDISSRPENQPVKEEDQTLQKIVDWINANGKCPDGLEDKYEVGYALARRQNH